jgi:hypothetical protein
MGNIISHDQLNKELYLSNGGFEALMISLLLSGSKLAKDSWEITLIQWLAENDQNVVGLGIVGFDLSEIYFHQKDFIRQKDFILNVIEDADSNHRWMDFGFSFPNILEYLKQLKVMIEQFNLEHLKLSGWEWWASKPKGQNKCPTHQVYLHALTINENCLLCNLSRT